MKLPQRKRAIKLIRQALGDDPLSGGSAKPHTQPSLGAAHFPEGADRHQNPHHPAADLLRKGIVHHQIHLLRVTLADPIHPVIEAVIIVEKPLDHQILKPEVDKVVGLLNRPVLGVHLQV